MMIEIGPRGLGDLIIEIEGMRWETVQPRDLQNLQRLAEVTYDLMEKNDLSTPTLIEVRGKPTFRIKRAKTADMKVTKQIVGDGVRITVGEEYYGDIIRIQELPGRPLKRKLRRLQYDDNFTHHWTPEFRTESGSSISMTSVRWMFSAESVMKEVSR